MPGGSVPRRLDLMGQRFQKLLVISRVANRPSHWLCLCDCGKETTVWTNNLRSKRTRSCGCLRPQPKLCSIELCSRRHKGKGYCDMHLARLKNNGDPCRVIIRTRGSGSICKGGYKTIANPGHPNAWGTGRMFEHVLVMSNFLGSPLSKYENVHHKNGVRDDNRLENLELWSVSQPSGQRIVDRVAHAVEILQQYAPELLANPASLASMQACPEPST